MTIVGDSVKGLVGVVFLDITKAYDTLTHNLLLSKLSSLGRSASAIYWLDSSHGCM